MFKEELKNLTARIPSARGAIIMGLDGIAVEKYGASDGVNLEAFSAEYLGLLKKTIETNRELGIGRVQELTVFTESLVAIIKAVTPEYFLICALAGHSNFGQARYELRKSVLRLAKEFV